MRQVVKIFWLALLILNSAAQAADYLERLLPPGVAIGIQGDALREIRKAAIQRTLSEDHSAKDYDLIERLGPATIGWYYIRDGKLSGYMRTTKASLLAQEQQQVEREIVLPTNGSGFTKEAEEQVLRTNQRLESLLVSAVKWKSESNDFKLYTVLTDEEITAIVFNSSSLSRNDFFANPSLKEKFDTQAKAIREKTGMTEQAPGSIAASQFQTNAPINSDAQNASKIAFAPEIKPTKPVKSSSSSASLSETVASPWLILVAFLVAAVAGALLFRLAKK